MLILVVLRILAMGKNPGQITLVDIRIPSQHIRIIMVETHMPQLPDETIGPHEIKHMYQQFIHPLFLENGPMHRIVNNTEENNDQHKTKTHIGAKIHQGILLTPDHGTGPQAYIDQWK